MNKSNYESIPALSEIYLEESYLIWVRTGLTTEIKAEFVLLPGHERYKSPKPSEQYCYEQGVLRFVNTEIIDNSVEKAALINSDLSIDFGNIDGFVVLDQRFSLSGDWGRLSLFADRLMVAFD